MGKKKLQTNDFRFTKGHKRLLLGSVFLMATSAIGPAFLTQTAVFTGQFAAALPLPFCYPYLSTLQHK